MRKYLLSDTILAEPTWRHICFAEQDAADAPGAGGPSADGDDESDLVAEEEEPADGEAVVVEDDGLTDLEIGPDKLRVDKRVKDAWDGVQKSAQTKVESAAAREKAAEERETRAQEFFSIASSFAEELTEIKAIDKQLAPFEKMTTEQWMKWGRENPDEANEAMTAINALKLQRDKLGEGLKGKLAQAKQKDEAARTEAAAKAEREIATQIKDWSPAKREALQKGVNEHYGITAQEFSFAASHAGSLKMIEDALAFRRIKAKAAAIPATRKAEEPAPVPVEKVRSNAPATGLRDNMNMKTWAKGFEEQRQKHLSAKRGR